LLLGYPNTFGSLLQYAQSIHPNPYVAAALLSSFCTNPPLSPNESIPACCSSMLNTNGTDMFKCDFSGCDGSCNLIFASQSNRLISNPNVINQINLQNQQYFDKQRSLSNAEEELDTSISESSIDFKGILLIF
jgi:hypothetical protein